MRYYRQPSAAGDRLLVEADDGTYDLTAATPDLSSFADLARTAAVTGDGIDGVAERLLDRAPAAAAPDEPGALRPDEVWAAGVTYEISEEARESESGMPEVYLDVYEGERPEIFFKATPGRVVGPGEAIGIREDSTWDVPEPELGVVLHRGEVMGYTIGNDVSSRSIEGDNPLYLPQAKVYDRCCALGPCVASAESIEDPHDLEIAMEIDRDGETVFEGTTATSEMARTCEELVSYYRRHNRLPESSVLLTGTSLVPPDEFTLAAGDVVTISIESIGTLETPVVTV